MSFLKHDRDRRPALACQAECPPRLHLPSIHIRRSHRSQTQRDCAFTTCRYRFRIWHDHHPRTEASSRNAINSPRTDVAISKISSGVVDCRPPRRSNDIQHARTPRAITKGTRNRYPRYLKRTSQALQTTTQAQQVGSPPRLACTSSLILQQLCCRRRRATSDK